MVLPDQITTREYQKFVDVSPGETAVRVTGQNFQTVPSGLTVGGKITEVIVTDSAWAPLPAAAFANRNQLNIQNESAFNIKIRYDNVPAGYVGVTIASGSERQYAIKDTITIYAKFEPGGSGTIQVEELA